MVSLQAIKVVKSAIFGFRWLLHRHAVSLLHSLFTPNILGAEQIAQGKCKLNLDHNCNDFNFSVYVTELLAVYFLSDWKKAFIM